MQAATQGVCNDPWVTEVVTKVAGRPPNGSGNTGECDIYRYGNGSWSSKQDLEKKVRAAFAAQPPASGATGICTDPWVTEVVTKVAGRPPNGSGNTGECETRRYGNGQWSSKQDLESKVRAAFGLSQTPPAPTWSGQCYYPALTAAITKVLGRPPLGQSTQGECNPGLYGFYYGQWPSQADLEQKVRDAIGKTIQVSGQAPSVYGRCTDLNLTNAITKVMGRLPLGGDRLGECDPALYGAYANQSDLEIKVRNALGKGSGGLPTGTCSDPWLTELITQIAGRAPQGAGTTGECDPTRYGTHWAGKEELRQRVAKAFGKSLPTSPTNPGSSPGNTGNTGGKTGNGGTPAPGVCSDSLLTSVITFVAGRPPNGSGATGECDPKRYSKWGGNHDLQRRVEFAFGRCTGDPNKPFSDLYFENLDYGLYFFGKGNTCAKFIPGEKNPYYDPKKPTMVYVHGWQQDTTTVSFRESFQFDPQTNMGDAWIADGWNIAIFYWNQFADEGGPPPVDAEAKVWSASGPKFMRWRARDGSYRWEPNNLKSAGELFFDAYTAALKDNTSGNIRVVGHSLGNQMAVRLTKLVSDAITAGKIGKHLLPKRVALLDPYYSEGEKSYLKGQNWQRTWTGERARDYVAELKAKGVIWEIYQSSLFGDLYLPGLVDSNPQLRLSTAYVHLWPSYNNDGFLGLNIPANLKGNHIHAIRWYFTSYAYKTGMPTCQRKLWWVERTAQLAPSAGVSDKVMIQYMNSGVGYNQIDGQPTADVKDDCFEIGGK